MIDTKSWLVTSIVITRNQLVHKFWRMSNDQKWYAPADESAPHD